MMYLYIYKGYSGGCDRQRRSEDLVRRAAVSYINEEQLALGRISGQILRNEKGKPYFKEVPIEFSVSHTGDLWVCLIDRDPVGVDIQEVRKSSRDKIAERCYSQDEKDYVQAMGEEGFFQIWTRKEAYAKYLGTGIAEVLKGSSTLSGVDVEFIDFDIKDGVKGSCCSKEKKELWIREIA